MLDRYCGQCHQGQGAARQKLDLTLRPGPEAFKGQVFQEPYLTLIGPAAWPVPVPTAGQPGYGLAGAFPVYNLQPDDMYPNDPLTDQPSTILNLAPPALSVFPEPSHRVGHERPAP